MDKNCGEKCSNSDDCGGNLFCCPNNHLCMDPGTKSTRGPSCGGGGGGQSLATNSRTQCKIGFPTADYPWMQILLGVGGSVFFAALVTLVVESIFFPRKK